MPIVPLQERLAVPELMDAPDLEGDAHLQALAGLARLNRAARAAVAIARPILALARRERLSRLTLLDVACGGGDVPVAVAEILQDVGFKPELTLTDRSDTALAAAQEYAARAGIPARCVRGEAPHGLPAGKFDVVTNSLFLHHLEATAAAETLIAMKARARRLVVVSDLRRSALGWLIAWSACRLLSRSKIVHFDGPVSVRAAWSLAELRGFAARGGMERASIDRSWPWRMLLTWETPMGERCDE